jgi:hypothetical protein
MKSDSEILWTEVVVAYFKVLRRYFPGENEGIHEHLPEHLVLESIFEAGNFHIWKGNTSHHTEKFGLVIRI